MKRILITGGSGMIGRHLTDLLRGKGYDVAHLGRTRRASGFVWDPEMNVLDPEALKDVDAIVHLAGAGVADKRWNDKHKREIRSSRIDTTRMLVQRLKSITGHRVTTLVSASGIAYYGLGNPAGDAFKEADPPGRDFMAEVSVAWENEIRGLDESSIRTVMIRTGVVLTAKGGALEKMATPVKFFVGAPLGSGEQCVNWIHIDDLCSLYIKALEDSAMRGPYNAVSPNPVTNRTFTHSIARVLKRPIWLPAIPDFAVKLIAGGVADLVLRGGKVSSARTEQAGFVFKYPSLMPALEDLLKREK